MPTIEIEIDDFQSLLGLELPRKKRELDKILTYVKGEIRNFNANIISIELKDSNRADIWGVEGLARALRGYLDIETGLKEYIIKDISDVKVEVDYKLRNIRPYIGCSVVRNVTFTDITIRQLMHFQDKLDQTYGRYRRKTSIGLYNYDLISPPLFYRSSEPREVRFVPLNYNEKLTLEEILEQHPKGTEYGHLINEYPVWPVLLDSKDQVLSFPPITNSDDLGKITKKTKNVLVEVTGTSHETVLDTLTTISVSLADRGGDIQSVNIHYPYGNMCNEITPCLKPDKMEFDTKYVHKIIGVKLNSKKIQKLLGKARYGISKIKKSSIVTKIPCYRGDVLHPIDVVEDIAIAYDYNKILPHWPDIKTIGKIWSTNYFRNLVREILIGLGFQEILSFIMTNPESLFKRMNLRANRVVEIANPKLASMKCLRNWLLPSLMEFLSHNTHVEYPQKVSEIGLCVIHDKQQENMTREIEKLAAVTISSNSNFTEAKALLNALLLNLNVKYTMEAIYHPSYIAGRTGKILVETNPIGILGEIHPQVLQNWGLKNPAAAFEVNLLNLQQIVQSQK